MSGEHLPDSRESVEGELKYAYFDHYYDEYLAGEYATFDEAIYCYAEAINDPALRDRVEAKIDEADRKQDDEQLF